MLGWIMPDPLATPTTRAPPDKVAATSFDTVSVVRMACAKGDESSASVCAATGMAAVNCARGSRCPMTPVLAVSTSCTRSRPSTPAAEPARSSLSHVPFSPLAQLALPLLTTRARTGVPAAYLARLRATHGAFTRLVVDDSAHTNGNGEYTSPRSLRLDSLIPAVTPDTSKP